MTPEIKKKNFFASFIDSVKYGKELFVLLIVALLIAAGLYGYYWYQNRQEQVAYKIFARNVDEYERASREGKREDWASLEMLFKMGFDQYSHTALAPYFLIYQAQAMKNGGKDIPEYKPLLDQALTLMPSKSSLLPLYQIKVALLQMDLSEDQVALAVKTLRTISQDTKSSGFDIAAYYLGLYYWTHDNQAQATEVWTMLIDSQKNVDKLGKSPWAALAKSALGITT